MCLLRRFGGKGERSMESNNLNYRIIHRVLRPIESWNVRTGKSFRDHIPVPHWSSDWWGNLYQKSSVTCPKRQSQVGGRTKQEARCAHSSHDTSGIPPHLHLISTLSHSYAIIVALRGFGQWEPSAGRIVIRCNCLLAPLSCIFTS